jgi:hypothetical protein
MNYEKDMRIDESSLDVEWLEQAELAIKYGQIWAEAHKKLLEADEKIKIIKAELIKKVNKNPKDTIGKDKPTDSDKEAYYRTHPQHIKAVQEFIDAQYEYDMVGVAKNEVSFTRKSALENLVTLFGQSYFAGPSVPRNIQIERKKRLQERDKAVNASISSKLRIRRKTNDDDN